VKSQNRVKFHHAPGDVKARAFPAELIRPPNLLEKDRRQERGAGAGTIAARVEPTVPGRLTCEGRRRSGLGQAAPPLGRRVPPA